MRPVESDAAGDQVFDAGSYSSALATGEADVVLKPPVTSTLPFGSRVAV